MTRSFMNFIWPTWILLAFFSSIPACWTNAADNGTEPEYRLILSFDPEHHLLRGEAYVDIPAGRQLLLDTGGLTITGMRLKRQGSGETDIHATTGDHVVIPADTSAGELYLAYTYRADTADSNRIDRQGIVLLSGWYPQPDDTMHFQVEAALPPDFTAISESDSFPLQRTGDTVRARFSQAINGPHFFAGPYRVDSLAVRQGLQAYTLFFPEDGQLAASYLDKVREYLLRYEQEIGPYPYNHFVVVANRLPTGLSMPTLTLLGQAVLRLPFIIDTSLGHEVLHSWFGSSVSVAPGSGNWCEGLTSYLADHAYRRDKGDDIAYRYESLTNYLSYVHADNAIALTDFHDASMNQDDARARRAVGYTKAMLLFHELHERLGHTLFMQAVRSFSMRYSLRSASWEDLVKTFVDVSGRDELAALIHERLQRTDAPAIAARNIETIYDRDTNILTFTLIQETDSPYTLRVPVTVRFLGEQKTLFIDSREKETQVRIPIDSLPLSLTLDEDLSFFRQLTSNEQGAVWSRFLGSNQPLVILAQEEERGKYLPLLTALGLELHVRSSKDVTNAELADHDLLLMGLDQLPVRNLFARPAYSELGFTLDVRPHPLSPGRVAVIAVGSDKQETTLAASRLSHYGKYGFLHFMKGRALKQQIPEPDRGIRYMLDQLPNGVAVNRLDPFETLVAELAGKDVVYIGETHTSASDHRLQLRLIEALAAKGNSLIIGMEMFPSASQPALDAYILGKGRMTERAFLKDSNYFEVWQFDYRYYRDIIQFARAHLIPVVGLNLDREIVSSVYRTGSTDELTADVFDSVVKDRDLTLPGYGERLAFMHTVHSRDGHGSGLLSGFIQAQGLWDETMAANIVSRLRQWPQRQMLVLAGNQHTRKDSGIPPRVARRIEVNQATVHNIAGDDTPSDSVMTADYLFFSDHFELPPAGLMGITLKEEKKNGTTRLSVTDFTEASQAEEAGLKRGDRLHSLDDFPVVTLSDVRIAMTTKKNSNAVTVRIERDEDSGPVYRTISVPLVTSGTSHPN